MRFLFAVPLGACWLGWGAGGADCAARWRCSGFALWGFTGVVAQIGDAAAFAPIFVQEFRGGDTDAKTEMVQAKLLVRRCRYGGGAGRGGHPSVSFVGISHASVGWRCGTVRDWARRRGRRLRWRGSATGGFAGWPIAAGLPNCRVYLVEDVTPSKSVLLMGWLLVAVASARWSWPFEVPLASACWPRSGGSRHSRWSRWRRRGGGQVELIVADGALRLRRMASVVGDGGDWAGGGAFCLWAG